MAAAGRVCAVLEWGMMLRLRNALPASDRRPSGVGGSVFIEMHHHGLWTVPPRRPGSSGATGFFGNMFLNS